MEWEVRLSETSLIVAKFRRARDYGSGVLELDTDNNIFNR